MNPSYISLEPLVQWLNIKRPIQWDQIFPQTNPIEVEIGFGQAEYLIQQAIQHPNRNFIGIELGWISIKKALRKIAKAKVQNVRLLQGDARVIFERAFSEQSIDRIYSLFPCPWPKKRHVKHRLFSSSFLQLINNRLVEGGETLIVTDFKPYAEWIISQTKGTGFQVVLDQIPPLFKTKYEKKWQEQGQKTFYALKLQKSSHIEIKTAKEVALKTYRIETFSPHLFHPKSYKSNGIVVEFKEQLFDQIRQKAMVRALVAEGNFIQTFWIEVLRKDNFWHIRPAKGCSIIPTQGIQKALDSVFDAAKLANCPEEC